MMMNSIKEKLSGFNYELDYRVRLWRHARNLPALEESDRLIVDSLKTDGIFITILTNLGLNSTSNLLNASHSLLPTMGTANYSDSNHNPPKIYVVTDFPDFYNWGKEQKILNIIENYLGLPVAFHGVHLRKDLPNQDQFGTLLWHRDIEDRRVLKIIVYLHDVEEKHGPFEYVPVHLTSRYHSNYYRIQDKIKNSGGINDETLNQIVPKSAWKSCTGPAGTVIFADTRKLLHHGTLRTQERSTLFFAYTADPPKRPHLCTHFWDDTHPKPEFDQKSD